MEKSELNRRIGIVVDDCGGIIPYCFAFYIQSIAYSATCADRAFTRFENLRDKKANPTETVSAVHEALGHIGALSRFFWPPAPKEKSFQKLANARAASLRKLFDVADTSPLKNRQLRNALEHFEERLDEYLLSNDAGYFFPDAIVDHHTAADEVVGKIFKLVDPDNGYFVVLGEKFQFFELIEETRKIFKSAKAMG